MTTAQEVRMQQSWDEFEGRGPGSIFALIEKQFGGVVAKVVRDTVKDAYEIGYIAGGIDAIGDAARTVKVMSQ